MDAETGERWKKQLTEHGAYCEYCAKLRLETSKSGLNQPKVCDVTRKQVKESGKNPEGTKIPKIKEKCRGKKITTGYRSRSIDEQLFVQEPLTEQSKSVP